MPRRDLRRIAGHDCGVRALAHALDKRPTDVYDAMRRDSAERIPSIGVAAYAPGELATCLWYWRVPHLVVDLCPEGAPVEWWGVFQPIEIHDWCQRGRRAALAFKLDDQKGHWVGFNGWEVSGVRGLGLPDAGDREVWGTFKARLRLDPNEMVGSSIFHRVELQYAILIE